ncbi:MAG TPA: hypothetical protein VFS20_31025 [Longimicrobium sp.]|nr:hypothetical protein [Longimicrobium sp.]
MITLTLWQWRWRLLVIAAIGVLFYLWEPGFHLHGELPEELSADVADPRGIAFTLANLAGAGMLVLLSGFISADRREGFYRIYFSHPTRPLSYYAVRWLIAYALSVGAAAVFLVVGQLLAWGELRVGLGAMVQPLLFALVYGGLVAFFSVLLPRGDSLAALGIFVLTSAWEYALSVFAEMGTQPLGTAVQQAISFILPPHLALRDLFQAAETGAGVLGPLAFAGGYGLFWLVIAGLLLWSREWP